MVGQPRDVLCGCLYMDSDVGYMEARNLLDKQYGDPYKLSILHLSPINDWPVSKQDDNEGIKRVSLCFDKM